MKTYPGRKVLYKDKMPTVPDFNSIDHARTALLYYLHKLLQSQICTLVITNTNQTCAVWLNLEN